MNAMDFLMSEPCPPGGWSAIDEWGVDFEASGFQVAITKAWRRQPDESESDFLERVRSGCDPCSTLSRYEEPDGSGEPLGVFRLLKKESTGVSPVYKKGTEAPGDAKCPG